MQTQNQGVPAGAGGREGESAPKYKEYWDVPYGLFRRIMKLIEKRGVKCKEYVMKDQWGYTHHMAFCAGKVVAEYIHEGRQHRRGRMWVSENE